jgi:hypothetical protein
MSQRWARHRLCRISVTLAHAAIRAEDTALNRYVKARLS